MPDPYAEFSKPAAVADPYAEFATPAVAVETKKKTETPGYFEEALSGLGRVASNIASIPKQLLTPHETYGATREEEVKMGPTGRLLYNIPADILKSSFEAEGTRQAAQRQGEGGAGQTLSYLENSMAGPVVKKAEEAGPGYAKLKPATVGAVTEGVGTIEVPRAAGAAVSKGLSKVGELRRSMAPTEVPIAGEKVSTMVGEAHPESRFGRMQAGLKISGLGEGRFTKFDQAQQAQVKAIIRKTAQQTSAAIGPMPDEPADAVGHAADTTFRKATPMYDALDSSLKTIPDSMANVSKVTEQAIARAKKLGVEVEIGGGSERELLSRQIYGKGFDELDSSPTVKVSGGQGQPPKEIIGERANIEQLLKDQAAKGGQPISTYMKVRSELLKMQRATPDAALRNHIAGEISTMNANMETALKGTPLYDNWLEANRLWSKGYALREVGDAIRAKTHGTPVGEQAPALSPVPTKIQGDPLVTVFNDLKHDGVLDRAFTTDEIKNLRQCIDILDRASTPIGKGFKVGYGPHSTLYRMGLGLPFAPFVMAMTTSKGLMALKGGDYGALANIAAAYGAAGSQVKNRKDALQLLGQPTQ